MFLLNNILTFNKIDLLIKRLYKTQYNDTIKATLFTDKLLTDDYVLMQSNNVFRRSEMIFLNGIKCVFPEDYMLHSLVIAWSCCFAISLEIINAI